MKMKFKVSLFGWFFTLVMVTSMLFSANGSVQKVELSTKSKSHVSSLNQDHHFLLSENSSDDNFPSEDFIDQETSEELDGEENFFSKNLQISSQNRKINSEIISALKLKNAQSEVDLAKSSSIPFYLLFLSLKTDFC